MLGKVMIVSPHPDDETLGAAGTILKYKDSGYKVYCLNITNMKEEYGFDKEEIERRGKEIEKAINEYRFDGFFDLGLRPARLDGYPVKHMIEKISEIFIKVKPDTVILPYRNDIHSDHRIVFNSSYACTKVFRYPYIRKVLMMEIVSETDFSIDGLSFSPNYFVDISDYLERKIKIMKIYESELGKYPLPRSEETVRALATIRGSQAGCKYAEGFVLLKEIR